jgi:hypothetical protein
MSERKSFLLRIDQEIFLQVQRWADDELRSLNGQIEFLLRKALKDSGRAVAKVRPASAPTSEPPEDPVV